MYDVIEKHQRTLSFRTNQTHLFCRIVPRTLYAIRIFTLLTQSKPFTLLKERHGTPPLLIYYQLNLKRKKASQYIGWWRVGCRGCTADRLGLSSAPSPVRPAWSHTGISVYSFAQLPLRSLVYLLPIVWINVTISVDEYYYDYYY